MAVDIANSVDQAKTGASYAGNAFLEPIGQVLDFRLVQAGGVTLTVGALIGAVFVVLVTIVVSRLARRALERYAGRHIKANSATVYALSRITHYLLLALGTLFALSVAGIPVERFTLFASALGVGLGFGLQAIFSNFVSGLIILFDRTLKVGDFVELDSGVHGTVRDIYIRATRVATNDNIDIIVPNSEFVTKRVVNWTLRDVSRRVKIPFGVAYGSDKELVKKAALEAAAEVPFTLALDGPRMPQVWLTGFGESALKFSLVVWLTADATKRPGAVNAAYNWALESALQRHQLEMPFPQRDLHVRTWFGQAGAQASEEASRAATEVPHTDREQPTDNDAVRDVARDVAEEARSLATEIPEMKESR